MMPKSRATKVTLDTGTVKAQGFPPKVKIHNRLPDNHPAYALIGRVTAEWARLEHILDDIIWQMAGIRSNIGSCITGQMVGHGPRFNAISALGAFRGLSATLLRDIEKVQNTTSSLAKKRNRLVHDAWFIEDATGQIGQFRSFPPKAGIFGIETIDTATVQSRLLEITQRCDAILRLRDKILTALQPSR